MIEKELEARLCEVARRAYDSIKAPVRVIGAWQAVPKGLQKDVEGLEPAVLAIAVQPRSYENFGLGIATFEVSIALAIAEEQCPTGAELETYAAPIADMLDSLNRRLNCHNPCNLDVETFVPGGVMLTGGAGPTHDADAGKWVITWTLSIKGNIIYDNPDNCTTP